MKPERRMNTSTQRRVLMSKTNVLVLNATDQSPSPQPTSGVPTLKTFEVMVILTAKQGVTRQQIMSVMPAEVRATVKLYLDGKIRQWYSRGDGKGVIFLIDAKSVE